MNRIKTSVYEKKNEKEIFTNFESCKETVANFHEKKVQDSEFNETSQKAMEEKIIIQPVNQDLNKKIEKMIEIYQMESKNMTRIFHKQQDTIRNLKKTNDETIPEELEKGKIIKHLVRESMKIEENFFPKMSACSIKEKMESESQIFHWEWEKSKLEIEIPGLKIINIKLTQEKEDKIFWKKMRLVNFTQKIINISKNTIYFNEIDVEPSSSNLSFRKFPITNLFLK